MPSSLGPAEILVILVVALIVLGPNRLPQAGRQLGKALAEVRRWTQEMKSEIQTAVDFDDRPTYPSSPTPASTVTAQAQPSSATAVTAEHQPAPPAEAVSGEPDSSTAADPDFTVAAEPSAEVGVDAALPVSPTDASPEPPQGDSGTS